MVARLRLIIYLEMQACNVLYQPHFYFFIFCVIIPDCQLQKFTESTHKIAQQLQNVKTIVCGSGGGG